MEHTCGHEEAQDYLECCNMWLCEECIVMHDDEVFTMEYIED